MAQPEQAELTKFRVRRLDTVGHATTPAGGDGITQPDITLSPLSPTGMRTTGALLALADPNVGAATPIAAGFSIVPWIRNPSLNRWFSGATIIMPYDALFVSFDFDAVDLFFQILAASVAVGGDVDIHVAEL